MNLLKKRELAAKALGVGKNRISFNPSGLKDIKEAITKQDIITLHDEGIIAIKDVHGRTKVVKRKRRRGGGKIKMKIKNRKQDYVKITRKLRGYLKVLKNTKKIERELYYDLRKKIKMRTFKNMAHFRDYIENAKKSISSPSDKKTKTGGKKKIETKLKEGSKK